MVRRLIGVALWPFKFIGAMTLALMVLYAIVVMGAVWIVYVVVNRAR